MGGDAEVEAGVRTFLQSRLPDYMVPTIFMTLDEMPMTTNGKIDRRALPQPTLSQGEREAPEGEVETALAKIWSELLDDYQPARGDNFFQVGGHSLLAGRIAARIKHQFHRDIPLRTFFEKPVLKDMAAWIAQTKDETATTVAVPLRPAEGKKTGQLIFVHAATGEVWPYLKLAQGLAPDLDAIALQAVDSHGLSIPELAAHYIGEAGLLDLTETVTFVGWSLGGLIAWEIANQLAKKGRMHKLVLLDTYPLKGLPVQSPREQLASLANDLGLEPVEQQNLGATVPEDWAGEDITELTALMTHPPDVFNGWESYQIQALWRNYTAHFNAARVYLPRQEVTPHLLTARDLGELKPAQSLWQQAGYELHDQQVPGDHYSLLEEPENIAVTAQIIEKVVRGNGRDVPKELREKANV